MQRVVMLVGAIALMTVVAMLSSNSEDPSGDLILLKWAQKAPDEKAPVAVLVQVGLKDPRPTTWDGQATVTAAKVLRREPYRFRANDQLTDPDGWQIRTRRPVPRRRNRPNLTIRPEPAGVIYYLTDVSDDATMTLTAGEDRAEAKVALPDVLAGTTQTIWNGNASVSRVSMDQLAEGNANSADDCPAACYAPDGTLWLAYVSYAVQDERRRFNFSRMDDRPDDFKDFYQPEFHDQVVVKSFRGGQWSKPIAVTTPDQDIARVAVAAQGDGTVWVAYSAHRDGQFDIYARSIRDREPSEEIPITKLRGSNLSPVMCTDQSGKVWLACQSWNEKDGTARIELFSYEDGNWNANKEVDEMKSEGNQWHPAISAGPNGEIAIAYDVYHDGDYDVRLSIVKDDELTHHRITATPRFEVRPAICYDPAGRLWIAYEEGPEKWGKDYGALVRDEGSRLYAQRIVRVVCLTEEALIAPATAPPTATPPEANVRAAARLRTAYPKLGLDGKGNVWLTFREKIRTPFGVQPGTEWVTRATRYEGNAWSEPMEITHSGGLLDSRPVLLPRSDGGLWMITNSDSRWITPGNLNNDIYTCVIDLPGEAEEPQFQPSEPPSKKPNPAERRELADVKRIREYRLKANGKTYQLRRGEFHRHTEISFDGGNDGSLEDMFRYAIDAAHLDWIGNGDHDNGAGKEYTWWMTQKYSDAYRTGNSFVPMFTYERSVSYPHGHRNCVFAKRGVLPLPRLAEPDQEERVAGIHADDTKILYRYLHALDGVCAVHTSATSMGTDWRDNDPDVEPFVEIYQGARNSYEMEGAPRVGYPADSGKQPVNIAGWYPKGYIDLALKKGYKLGFQSSSDHIATHISYCILIAENPSREAMLDAMKKRHCYGATDNIILDVRCGDAIMGDECQPLMNQAPKFDIKVQGTEPIAAVRVFKDSELVATFEPDDSTFQTTWTDPKPSSGTHWYYVRVRQKDDELAWGSPIWVTRP